MDFEMIAHEIYKESAGNNKVSDFTGIKWNDVFEKGGAPAGEAYFKIYSPDGYNVIYTRDQANSTILAFKENDKALTSDFKNNPIHLVYVNGMQCHWVTLPVKVEISSTNPDEDCEMETNVIDDANASA